MERRESARRSELGPLASSAIEPAAAADGASSEQAVALARSVIAREPAQVTIAERLLITLSGVRQPIVAILVVISFLSALSGKPLDGLLIGTVATVLAWNAGLGFRELAKASLYRVAAGGQPGETDPHS